MGRPADEHLPEVVPSQPPPEFSLPEVAPDPSPEAGQPQYYTRHEKFPAHYDHAPKLPHEQPAAGMGMGLQSHDQQWAGAGDGVSALSPNSSVPWQAIHPSDDQQTYVASEPEQERRICGIRRRLFIIVAVVLAIVVIAAAVGGGVGGAMGARSASESVNLPAESGSSGASNSESTVPSTTPAITSASSTSSAPAPTITFLNNQTDGVGQAFQGFSEIDYDGNATEIIREEGFHDLPFKVSSYVWEPNGTAYCITYCYNKTKSAGWGC
ncbi:Plasma membrane fusion protein prm-1 [Madurella mycetomatis]|uniref:Plasma membrane fusion protein prm-1 n=1 Tax=Madurella mycetomatis TaxID=100816 RepID=A0A175WGW4_9PEZI|nr:Plasma membrane fusion protein prm-1 [Madurella mycetomatis]